MKINIPFRSPRKKRNNNIWDAEVYTKKKTPDWLATHTRKRKLKIQIKMHGKCSYNAAVINDKLQNYVYTYIHTYIIYLIYTYIFIYTFIYIILYVWYEPPISAYSLRV